MAKGRRQTAKKRGQASVLGNDVKPIIQKSQASISRNRGKSNSPTNSSSNDIPPVNSGSGTPATAQGFVFNNVNDGENNQTSSIDYLMGNTDVHVNHSPQPAIIAESSSTPPQNSFDFFLRQGSLHQEQGGFNIGSTGDFDVSSGSGASRNNHNRASNGTASNGTNNNTGETTNWEWLTLSL